MVGLLPDGLQMFKQVDLQAPGEGTGFEPIAVGCMQCISQLAIDVELQLLVYGVANAHRLAAFVTGSHGISYSVNRRSPARPYMICISAGWPAAARISHSRQARASFL